LKGFGHNLDLFVMGFGYLLVAPFYRGARWV